MKYFLTITFLLLTLLPANAVKKIEANPINIAAVTVEKTDSAQVASTFEYYGYSYDGIENGYTVMTRPDGSEIKFTFKDSGTIQKHPIIVVKTKEAHKGIKARLKELDFEKVGNTYERKRNKYSRYITQCNFGPHNTIIFKRIPNKYL